MNQEDLMQAALSDDPEEVKGGEEESTTFQNIPHGVTHQPSLYALGGCGIKIAAKIPHLTDLFKVTTIDTSTSEDALLTGNINRVYLSDLQDGSGAVKSAKYKVLSEGIPDIVDSTDPTDICYVIFSASGASGSTASFILMDQLLERGKNIIGICSINSTNELRTKNTVKTLLGLHNLCSKYNCNIPLFLGTEENLALQDEQSAAFISASATVLNPGIVGIDTSDRKNFLSPCFIKDINLLPSLLSLSLTTGMSDDDKEGENGHASTLLLNPLGASEGAYSGAKVVFSGLFDNHVKQHLDKILGTGSEFDLVALNTSFYPPYTLIKNLKEASNAYDKETTLLKQKTSRIIEEIAPPNLGGDIVL